MAYPSAHKFTSLPTARSLHFLKLHFHAIGNAQQQHGNVKAKRLGGTRPFQTWNVLGLEGFRNDTKTHTAFRVYVFIQLETGEWKRTHVLPTSLARPRTPPTNWAEALVDQHPDIDGLIGNMFQEISRCTLGDRLETNIEPLFLLMNERMKEHYLLSRRRRGHHNIRRVVTLDAGM
jgi:hypothetical protein